MERISFYGVGRGLRRKTPAQGWRRELNVRRCWMGTAQEIYAGDSPLAHFYVSGFQPPHVYAKKLNLFVSIVPTMRDQEFFTFTQLGALTLTWGM